MDRFIGSALIEYKSPQRNLKSNMDRIIDSSPVSIKTAGISFKIQYG